MRESEHPDVDHDGATPLAQIVRRFRATLAESAAATDVSLLVQRVHQLVASVDEASKEPMFRSLLALSLHHGPNNDPRALVQRYAETFPQFESTAWLALRLYESGDLPDGDASAVPAAWEQVAAGGQIDVGEADHFQTQAMPSDFSHRSGGSGQAGNGPTIARTTDSLTRGDNERVIGPYRLLERIGEGGMGTVWRAAQQHPVERMVALKIIKAGMDTREVIARFEAERQALALMEHPNIAKVLDAGATAQGRPYFVMELVKGIPITEYCDRHNLNFDRRVEIFITVCEAVQHAHQKGIIHRDIKPSNVLVAVHDDKPVAKVIDFGLAKATGAQLSETPLFTAIGQMVGTPAYMSPEQAGSDAGDIDTRTDIYSLGVLLYELLSGVTPLDLHQLHRAGYAEIQRIIRESDPPRMYQRLSTAGVDSSMSAKCRSLDPKRFSKAVRGDLEVIVMHALAKERNRRYPTAVNFAADLQRYLRNEPIEARPASSAYRIRKLVQRNRGLMLAGALILVALLVGLVEASRQAAIAKRNLITAVAEKQNAVRAERIAAANEVLATEQKELAVASAAEARQAEQREAQQRAAAEEALYFSRIALAQNAWQSGNMSRALDHLQMCLPEPGRQDLRGWEWHYLNRLFHPELLVIEHPETWIYGVAFSPDGTKIATAGGLAGVPDDPDGAGGTLHLYDAASGRKIVGFDDSHLLGVRSVAFSPDGSRIVSGGGDMKHHAAPGQLRLWDTVSGRLISDIADHGAMVYTVAYSPDGSRIASGSGIEDLGRGDHQGELMIHDAATGEMVSRIDAHPFAVRTVAFSPDGSRIATAGTDGTAAIWDAATAGLILRFKVGDAAVNQLIFSGDGESVASCDTSGPITIWNTRDGSIERNLRGHDGGVLGIAFGPDGRALASVGADQAVRTWNLQTGEEIRRYRGHTLGARCLAFGPDASTLVSGGQDGTVRLWDLTHDPIAQQPFVGAGPPNPYVNAVGFAPDGTLRAAYLGGRILRWQPATDLPINHTVTSLCTVMRNFGDTQFSTDGNWLVGPSWWLRDAVVWDCDNGTVKRRFGDPQRYLVSLAVSGDGHVLALISRADRSPDSEVMLQLWNTESGDLLHSIPLPIGHHRGIAVDADGGRIAVALASGTVVLIDGRTGESIHDFSGHQGIVMAIAFSRDGSQLVSAGFEDESLRVWRTASGECLRVVDAPPTITHLAFSPDDRRLAATGFGGFTRLWSTGNWLDVLGLTNLAPRRPGDFAYNARVAFSPDGVWLASSHWDGSITAWNAAREEHWPRNSSAMDSDNDRSSAIFLWHLAEAQRAHADSDQRGLRFHLARIADAAPPNAAAGRYRGQFFARLGLYQQAEADSAQALFASPNDIDLWLLWAALRLHPDNSRNRDQRKFWETTLTRLTKQFRDGESPTDANEVARILMLVGLDHTSAAESDGQPPGGVPLVTSEIRTIVDRLLGEESQDRWKLSPVESVGGSGNPNAVHIVALRHYFRGRYQQCIALLEESIAAHGNWRAWHWNGFLIAMAHQRAGNDVEAREWLDRANQALVEVGGIEPGTDSWESIASPASAAAIPLEIQYWMISRLLAAEANRVVHMADSPAPTDPGIQSERDAEKGPPL
jgi:WD40 repeat protein/serine/threonine protein kinase